MQSRNQTFEPAFDHLRAFAAILILSYHSFQFLTGFMSHGSLYQASDRMTTNNPLFALILEGHTAVGLFIVMSGFLFARSAIGKDIDYKSFLRNRLLRIYPLYIALVVVILATNEGLTLQSLVMVVLPTGYLPSIASVGPVGSMFWAVAIEFQFYLIFPFLMKAMNDRGVVPLLAIICFAILVRFASPYVGGSISYISYWTSVGRVDQFLIGMMAARICSEKPALVAKLKWLFLPSILAVLGAALALNHLNGGPAEAPWKGIWPTIEGLMWAVFICGYLPIAKMMPKFLSLLFTKIGLISYSTYLLHVSILLIICSKHWYFRASGIQSLDALLTTCLVVWPIVLAVSALSYFAVEKPFLGLRIKYTSVPKKGAEVH